LIRPDPDRIRPDPISFKKSNCPNPPDLNLNPSRTAWLPPLEIIIYIAWYLYYNYCTPAVENFNLFSDPSKSSLTSYYPASIILRTEPVQTFDNLKLFPAQVAQSTASDVSFSFNVLPLIPSSLRTPPFPKNLTCLIPLSRRCNQRLSLLVVPSRLYTVVASTHSPRSNRGKLSIEQCEGDPDALARERSKGFQM
jgi:hypothetical protein